MGMTVVGNWTYSGDPSDSTRDQVRFLVGDTDEDDQLASDEEINWTLTVQSNTYYAAAMVARSIASRFSRLADKKTVGDLSLSYFKRKEAFESIATRLEDEANSPTLRAFNAYSGGISQADKDLTEADTDRVPPSFWVGMHDFPESEWTLGST